MLASAIRFCFKRDKGEELGALLQERSHPDSLRLSMEGPIVLFDGPCHLCQFSVRFILKREKAAVLKFASLQSDFAKELLERYGLCEELVEGEGSLVLIENGRGYLRSSAALRLASYLRFPWNLLKVFLLLPEPLRDGLYRFVAARRYRWFGKDEGKCSL